MRLSAARAKIRFGYASIFEVCFSGFVAGVVVFFISAGVYLCFAMLNAQSTHLSVFAGETGTLAGLFSIRIFDGKSISGAMVNLGVISAAFGVAGMMAGIILRHRVRREQSHSFFTRKIRIPVEVLSFLCFFAYAGLSSERLLGVYLASALVAAFLWRFWYRIILSIVSSLDVDRLMPKPG